MRRGVQNLFTVLFFLLAIRVSAQTKNTISLESLKKAELITDLLKDIPKDCKVTGYVFSMSGTDKKMKLKCVGNELRLEINAAFRNAVQGDKIVFDKVSTACLDKHKSKYTFNVVQ